MIDQRRKPSDLEVESEDVKDPNPKDFETEPSE